MTSRPITQHYHQGTHAGCDTTTLPLRVRNGCIYCVVCNGLIATTNTTIMQQLESVSTHLQTKIKSEASKARAENEDTLALGGPNGIGRRLPPATVIRLRSRS